MTSQVSGMPPSLLTHVRDSRRDRAKDLAALQAMITRHRINHAASALRWRGKGSPRALALARCRKKSRVSSDHRPPTSHGEDNKTGPSKLAGQLWVSSFLARSGCLQRGPSTVVLRGRGAPFLRRGDTMVVSMASWAPWCSGKPSATTSKRLVSGRFRGRRSMSRIITLVDTLAPASLHTRAAADSRAYPRRPNTQPARKLHGDGHESQVEGHTGSCGRKEAREARGDAAATP